MKSLKRLLKLIAAVAALIFIGMSINAYISGLAGICIGTHDVAYIWSQQITEDYVAVDTPTEVPQFQFTVRRADTLGQYRKENQIGLEYEAYFLFKNTFQLYWTLDNVLPTPHLKIDWG